MDGQPRNRILLIQATLLVIVVVVALVLMEAVLRLFPGAIGLSVLAEMKPAMRAEIAGRLGLPTRATNTIEPNERKYPGAAIHKPQPSATMLQFNEPADRKLGAKDGVLIDAKGFCNEAGKAERKADVLFLGDSFTFCTSVDPSETAAAVFERLSAVPSYNLGIGGTGPDTHLDMLMRHAHEFAPRVAVMGIYEGNDLRDLQVRNRFIKTGRDDRRRREKDKGQGWSYALAFIDANLRLARESWRDEAAGDDLDFRYSAPVGGEVTRMNVANKDHGEVNQARALANGRVSLEEFRQPLADYVAFARSAGIRPLLLYFPSMYTVYEGSVKFRDPEIGKTVQAFSQAQRRWFAENAAAIGYEFADITPLLQHAAGQGVMTHYPGNVHFTPAGHEIVARKVMSMLAIPEKAGN